MPVNLLHKPPPTPQMPSRLGSVDEVFARIDAIDPREYDKTRNYLDGAVTWLSPYITHGVINTRIVANRVLERHAPKACYRLLYELGWREYFHRIWQTRGNDIFSDLYQPQVGVESDAIPTAIVNATTGIQVLDEGLSALNKTGWMHNHSRMWVAGITCNVAHTHWKLPAQWLYYHLLDGDLASNTLSWQWIAGTFSHKQYIANQDNLNKYSGTVQRGTWLDIDYETLAAMATPQALKERSADFALPQVVPGMPVPKLGFESGPSVDVSLNSKVTGSVIALRSLWNLNPDWLSEREGIKHVLFIEQSQIDAWPMSEHRWAFIQHWVEQFGFEIWLGSVEALNRLAESGIEFIREEYPACSSWPGKVTEREFQFGLPEKPYRSFSQFWKQVK